MGVPRTLLIGMSGDDVAFLHALLNYHLPPPEDQLPLHGAGARDFGPRTETKVKKFQQIKQIDIGTKDYMDGEVGPHTWAELTKTQKVMITITPASPSGLERAISRHFPPPSLDLTLPPPFVGGAPPSRKDFVLNNIQVQAGGQGALPFSLHWGQRARSFQLQIVAVLLDRGSKANFHNEVQFGAQYVENRGPGTSSRRDLSLLAVLNQANLPGLGQGRWSWSLQEQFALIKSLSNDSGSIQGQVLPTVNLSLIKRGDNDVLQLTGQSGLVLELDPPGGASGNNWGFKVGWVAFLGVTGTYTFH
jgi:hypothetical protein